MTMLAALPLIAAASAGSISAVAVDAEAARGAADSAAAGWGAVDWGLVCRFDRACIERRPCFESHAQVTVTAVPDGLDLAQIDFGDGRVRLAAVRRQGIWTSLVTDPDIDHADRVEVLDFAADGRATLVVNDPGTAVGLISRTGTCVAAPEPRS